MKPLIVITGASSGIGAATARHFSNEGHPLLLLARRKERLEALALPNSHCVGVDISDTEAVGAAIDAAVEAFGPVDALINNAGVMLLGQVADQDPEQWQRMFDVNVLALLRTTQRVLGPMLERRGGTIINISSIAGRKTFPNHAAYCGTKFAVSAMSENLREEVASAGVRVISICPGAVETELLSHTTSEEIKTNYGVWKEAMGGALVPSDVAETVFFAYKQPARVCIREIVLAATGQEP